MRLRLPIFAIRSAVLLVFLLLLPADGSAAAREDTFSGRLVDRRTGAAVAGATVSVPGVAGAVKSDADGRFSWTPRPPVPFHVIVILSGGLVAHPVTIERADSGTVDIPVDPASEESLTVVGAAPSVSVAPASARTMISSTHIARRSPADLMQALETVPGVSQVSEGHAAVPAIRGLARGRTLVVIDGARVTSERRAGPSATFADPASFEGLDVARGPGSVAYGSDAIGGIISIRTRRAAAGTPLRVRGTGTLGAGIPEARGTLELTKGFSRGGVIVQAHARAASDWDSPEGGGAVLHSGWEDRGLLGRIDHEVGPGVLSATVRSDFGRDIERPRDSSLVRFYYPFEDSHRVTAAYEVPRFAGFHQLALTTFFGLLEGRTDQDRGLRAYDPVDRRGAAHRCGRLRPGRGARRPAASAGRRDTGRQRYDAERRWVLRRPFHGSRSGVRLFVADARPRAGGHRYRASGQGLSRSHPSGAVLPGSDRARVHHGKPELRPEKSLQLDAAAHYTRSRASLAAYFYRYVIADLIERYAAGPDLFFFRNRGRARLTGFEVEARADLGAGLALEAGASLGRGRALDDRAHLDDVGADTVSVTVTKEFARAGYAQARAAFSAGDDRAGPGEIATPGAAVVDLSGGYHLTANLALRTHIRNLLDAAYPASPDPQWVYAPGRSATVTLVVEY